MTNSLLCLLAKYFAGHDYLATFCCTHVYAGEMLLAYLKTTNAAALCAPPLHFSGNLPTSQESPLISFIS